MNADDSRHAYLIMVHKSLEQVVKLCHLLDDPRNDLYIHVDAKVRNIEAWRSRLSASVRQSRLVFVSRVKVNWGGYSQIKAELSLLKTATQDRKHAYYHLISGADLPLHNQDDIHAFFDAHSGTEFVSLGTMEYQKNDIAPRARYWYIWQEYIGNAPDSFRKSLRVIQKELLSVQRLLNVNLNKDNSIQHYYGGAQWFSITEQFARYIVKHERWIRKTFSKGQCVDEVFVQTLLLNSSFAERRYLGVAFDDGYRSIMRDIDWKRGRPYVWRAQDFNELMSSGFLFARKFDEDVDNDIIDRIYHALMIDQS